MDRRPEFQAVFDRLRSCLAPYAGDLIVAADEPGRYSLDFPPSPGHPNRVFAAAVQTGKSYVFNFRGVEEGTIAELDRLTAAAFEHVRRRGLPVRTP
jgi:hypothetical protein